MQTINLQIAENTNIRTVQTIIDEAKALGLRVVHRPEPKKSNVVSLEARRQMMANVSAEA
jgi:hypothetical protein